MIVDVCIICPGRGQWATWTSTQEAGHTSPAVSTSAPSASASPTSSSGSPAATAAQCSTSRRACIQGQDRVVLFILDYYISVPLFIYLLCISIIFINYYLLSTSLASMPPIYCLLCLLPGRPQLVGRRCESWARFQAGRCCHQPMAVMGHWLDTAG